MQGAVNSKTIYVHGNAQHWNSYFVDWGNLKQFSEQERSFLYPQVSPLYLLPISKVNDNNDLYSLLWVIADMNYSKHDKGSDCNDVPSSWLNNRIKIYDWIDKSNRRGCINIPEFLQKRLEQTEGHIYTTRTFEQILSVFRSFGGETKQLMTHQTEYYQFAIKFLMVTTIHMQYLK